MMTTAKILIVDDEVSIRITLEEVLDREGYRVFTAENGRDALEQIASQTFDLALIDLHLGDIEGTEVLAALSQQSPDTVAIMLTGYASLETAVEALRQGAHDYLFKPYKVVEIRESIRRGLLKRQQKIKQRNLLHQLEQSLSSTLANLRATTEEQSLTSSMVESSAEILTNAESDRDENRFLQQGDLIVDFLRHVITLDGHLLELSPTEFDLLAYLVSEVPRVVPTQELVREVQGYDSEPWEASEIARYHIYRLRQKIKDATKRTDVIRTVRGVGYTIGE
jgi:DNA-binding response OmpR family regulator